jgi:hypothetical protein
MLRPCTSHWVPVGPSPGVLTWPAPARPAPRWPTRFETGIDFDLGFLGDHLEKVVVDALQDAAVQNELKNTVVEVMDDPAVSASLRPHLMEAALWLSLAVTGGIVIGRLVTQRMAS